MPRKTVYVDDAGSSWRSITLLGHFECFQAASVLHTSFEDRLGIVKVSFVLYAWSGYCIEAVVSMEWCRYGDESRNILRNYMIL